VTLKATFYEITDNGKKNFALLVKVGIRRAENGGIGQDERKNIGREKAMGNSLPEKSPGENRKFIGDEY
jgi:hypothetical protein